MLSFLKSIGLIEVSLVQIIFYGSVWLIDDYFAILLTSVMTAILFATLLISGIAELIERSRVPRSYFKLMSISVVIPLVVAAFFILTTGITPF